MAHPDVWRPRAVRQSGCPDGVARGSAGGRIRACTWREGIGRVWSEEDRGFECETGREVSDDSTHDGIVLAHFEVEGSCKAATTSRALVSLFGVIGRFARNVSSTTAVGVGDM